MKEPNLPTKLANFGKAVIEETKAIVQGEDPVSPEEQHRRLTICVGCEYYDSGKCLLCGCNMTVKTKFRTAHCPFTPPKW